METFKKVITNSSVQITLVIGGVAVTLINMWIAVKLSPIASDIRAITNRVDAIETKSVGTDAIINRFDVLETSVGNISQDVSELKQSQLRIEDKIDLLRE